jgi:DNA-binding transcriptional LysR family regulator
MQYLVELVRWGAGVSFLPPMAIRAMADDVVGVAVTPAIRRDLCTVIARGRPPVGVAQALLELLNGASMSNPENAHAM